MCGVILYMDMDVYMHINHTYARHTPVHAYMCSDYTAHVSNG